MTHPFARSRHRTVGSRVSAFEPLERRTLLSVSPADATGTVATTTTVVASADHVALDATDTFTATVTPSVTGGPVPTGSIAFFSFNGTYPSETAPLDANGTATVTVPATVAGHIAFVAEYAGDTTYAASHSAGLSVAVDESPLVVDITRDTVPTAFVAGGKSAKGSVTVSLTNPTGTAITGHQVVHVFTALYEGGQTVTSLDVGTVSKSITVPAGATKPVTVPVNATADLATAGSYSFTASATNSAHLTSESPGGTAVPVHYGFDVATPVVDLAATVTAVSPVTTTPGKMLSITLAITNSGNVNAAGGATYSIYLSADGTAHSVAIIPAITKGLTVEPGTKPTIVHLKVKVPTAAAAMNLYPLVSIVQGKNSATAASTTSVAIG